MRKPTGNPNGRPPYQPTDADRATVKNMVAAGIPCREICECLGQDGIDEETMRKHFRREIHISRNSVSAFAMSVVVNALKAGDMDAAKFWLRCRAGWKETERHEITGADGGPVRTADVNPRELLIQALDGQPADVKASVARKLLAMDRKDGDSH